VTATCTGSDQRIGGGGSLANAANNAGLIESRPTGVNSWTVTNNNVKADVTAYVICAH